MYQLEEKNLEQDDEGDTTLEAIEEQTDQNEESNTSKKELDELNLEEELGFDPLDLELDLGLSLLDLEEQLDLDDLIPNQDPSSRSPFPAKTVASGAKDGSSSAEPRPGLPVVSSNSAIGNS